MTEVQIEWKKLATCNKIDDKKAELFEVVKLLQEELSFCVDWFLENVEYLYHPALQSLCSLIKALTTPVKSVPKQLNFMKTHHNAMQEIYGNIKQEDVKKESTTDIIFVLSITISEGRKRLEYRVLSELEQIKDWGHEYVIRHLTEDWTEFTGNGSEKKSQLNETLMLFGLQIVTYIETLKRAICL